MLPLLKVTAPAERVAAPRSNNAPLICSEPLVNAPFTPSCTVPNCKAITPVRVFAPFRITVPAPVLVNAPEPFNIAVTVPVPAAMLVAVNVPPVMLPPLKVKAPTV